MRALPVVLLTLPALAQAAPTLFTHQGRLLDAAGGAIEGRHDLTISLHGSASGGATVYQETFDAVLLQDGYFTLAVGQGGLLDTDDLPSDQMWIGVTVDGTALAPRVIVTPVPWADRATSAIGGVVDVGEIRVSGSVVIGADGRLVRAALPAGAVALPSCSEGDVPRYSGSQWTCAPASPLSGELFIAASRYAAQTASAGAGPGGRTGTTSSVVQAGNVSLASTAQATDPSGASPTSGTALTSAAAGATTTSSTGLSTLAAGDHSHTVSADRAYSGYYGYCNGSPPGGGDCTTSANGWTEIRTDSNMVTYLRVNGIGGHTHSISGHTHTTGDHTHSIAAHTHTAPSHTHGVAEHTHAASAHTHTTDAHTHTGFAHNHDLTVSTPSEGWLPFTPPLPFDPQPSAVTLSDVRSLDGSAAAAPPGLAVVSASRYGFAWRTDGTDSGRLVRWEVAAP